jgi:hypothetical protein
LSSITVHGEGQEGVGLAPQGGGKRDLWSDGLLLASFFPGKTGRGEEKILALRQRGGDRVRQRQRKTA